jgi:hypothetical protein
MSWNLELVVLRTVLLISLSITLIYMLYRRFRYNTLQKDVPVVQHAELTGLDVAYHPCRLHLGLRVPRAQELWADLLDDQWQRVHSWPSRVIEAGKQQWELPLDDRDAGTYYLRLWSVGQSTERKFTLRTA